MPWFLCTLSSAGTEASAAPPVVGGSTVEHGDWPDVVAILTAEGGLCSGTLLAADLVITAAHCIDAVPQEVIVGSIDLAEPDGHRRRVKWSRAYPSWTESYDVGVVMLENPVLAKQRAIAQGCTTGKHLAPGAKLELVGFGQTTRGATDDNTQLHRATIEVVDATCAYDAACEPSIAPGGEFIAGGRGTDACFGDSGGPVYVQTARGPALIGIVSRGLVTFGDPCGDGGVFVRADKVVSWIQRVSGRLIDRAPCDVPADADHRDLALDPAGCSAGAGALHSGLATLYALLYIAAMRRTRARAQPRRSRVTL